MNENVRETSDSARVPVSRAQESDPRLGFIARTGQSWRIGIRDTAAVVGIVIFLGAWRAIDELLLCRIVMNVGIGIGVLGWVWLSLTTRCPHCRYRVMFFAYENFSVFNWSMRARAIRRCPKCGYDPE